ncbi:NAD-dependent protein deacetylase [Actinacidiphila guanduensis]|uniref:NAD-dependent protein deacetylase n=1 Tax=Actinacidiphila guanduensis TaxID=310781 RepID=A0A1H0KHG4_9ACTN|nr:NAD-dependent protein deacetylase [Actinacidiphila guanduensis]SDO55379.1 NAD-dependent protein deacetylase, SIR2 family [Actinacidiphila guanduensis]
MDAGAPTSRTAPGPTGATVLAARATAPAQDPAGPAARAAGPDAPDAGDVLERVAGLLAGGGVVVLSGAGLSTESGIPDYRGATGRQRKGTPMTFQEFTAAEAGRQRYWARSYLGFTSITGARPNPGHRAVARLAAAGLVTGVITQNVDGLHAAAGTPDAVELHGSLHHVVCLSCGDRSPRQRLQQRLAAANPDFRALAAQVRPDGDADLDDTHVAGFRVVACEACGAGTLKPDVVFFGESVPRPRVDRCFALVDQAAALLVLGSSLTVMSGLRFVRHAAKQGIPVAIVNQGATRGDALAAVRVDRPLGAALADLLERLGV